MSAFFSTVLNVVIHTPIWVWPLYALLLFLGLQRTRDRSLPLWRELILPIVTGFFATLTLLGAGQGALPAMLLGLAIGGFAGWQLKRTGDTRRLPDGRLWLRGEWWTFTQIVIVLIFRYSINVVPALNPGLYTDVTWHVSTLFISAILSGLFLGRTAARLWVYFAKVPANA